MKNVYLPGILCFVCSNYRKEIIILKEVAAGSVAVTTSFVNFLFSIIFYDLTNSLDSCKIDSSVETFAVNYFQPHVTIFQAA